MILGVEDDESKAPHPILGETRHPNVYVGPENLDALASAHTLFLYASHVGTMAGLYALVLFRAVMALSSLLDRLGYINVGSCCFYLDQYM